MGLDRIGIGAKSEEPASRETELGYFKRVLPDLISELEEVINTLLTRLMHVMVVDENAPAIPFDPGEAPIAIRSDYGRFLRETHNRILVNIHNLRCLLERLEV